MIKLKKITGLILLIGLFSNVLLAQTPQADLESTETDPNLIRSTTHKYKIHFGIEGGLGMSQLLNRPGFLGTFSSETSTSSKQYGINLIPKVEARFNIFSEYEAASGWGIKAYVGYLGKGVPKVREFNNNGIAGRGTDYMHYLVGGFMFYTKSVGKVRFGFGLENHLGFKVNYNSYQDLLYKNALNHFVGIKGEVCYKMNSRLSLNTYIMGGIHGTVEGKALVGISGGVTLAYRLCGKKIKEKVDVYRINYATESLKLKKSKPPVKPGM
ncbi:MAG: hypothetical protein MK212_09735 [Saprospiraceae bacterium]|nr:hypothetical protein [Saprospiraceae bacterium]